MVDDEVEHNEDNSYWSFNSVKVEVQAMTSVVQTSHTMNKVIITTVALANTLLQEFECDTAASHSVLSLQAFKELARMVGRLEGKKEQVAVRLADGSESYRCYGSITLVVQGYETPAVTITFFVLDGPSNLLGRFALEQLWPQYKALRDVATYGRGKVSLKMVKGEVSNAISSPHQSWPQQQLSVHKHGWKLVRSR